MTLQTNFARQMSSRAHHACTSRAPRPLCPRAAVAIAALLVSAQVVITEPSDVHAQSSDRADVIVMHVDGARTREETLASEKRIERLLRACADAGRTARGVDNAVVLLAIDTEGHAAAAVLTDGDPPERARAWHGCVTRVIAGESFGPGGAGVAELVVRWDDGDASDQLFTLAPEAVGSRFGFGGIRRRGSVSRDPLRASDSLTTLIAARVLQAHQGEVAACYERAVERSSGIAGRLVLVLEIARDGSISSATVEQDTIADHELRECVLQGARRWSFPSFGGATARVEAGFRFALRRSQD